MRLAAVLLLCAAAAAEGESRLGTLIRWYLNEKSPARQQEYLETIERITDFEEADLKKSLKAVRAVAAAIRRGEHFRHAPQPAFAPPTRDLPPFSTNRGRIQPVADAVGRYATLALPDGYTPARAYPLLVDLEGCSIEVPPDTVHVRVVRLRPLLPNRRLATREAWRAEALVLSIVAHVFEIAHIDPDRVFLRAEGPAAALVWHIALHNPDRFAGVLGAQGYWPGGARLAANAAHFAGLVIERRGGDPRCRLFVNALREYRASHVHLMPPEREEATDLLPAIRAWWDGARRPPPPDRLELVSDRNARVRSYWLRMAPRARSQRTREVGQGWTQKSLARPGTVKARIRPGNLVEVEADRVVSFTVYPGLDQLDFDRPLRVSINGGVPSARLIQPQIEDLLEDYRERRDPGLLYPCALKYTVR